jgi:hypothetical protein
MVLHADKPKAAIKVIIMDNVFITTPFYKKKSFFQIKPAASSGVLAAFLQSAGFQPAFAPWSEELNPQGLNTNQY